MTKRKREYRLPTDREISLMLSAAAKCPRDQLIVILETKLGLRASETANLRMSDLDWGGRTVSFTGKGNKPTILPLTDEVLDHLRRILAKRPANHTHDRVVWDMRHNKGISRFGIYYTVKKYEKVVKIKLWPHLLRHKYGKDVFALTGDIYKTKEALRHSRLETTSRYVHPGVEDKRKDLELLDSRSWLQRVISKLKPPIPEFLTRSRLPVFKGETVGRKPDISKLKTNISADIHVVVSGQGGVGKSHLLRQLDGFPCFKLDELSPPRERLLELGQQMVKSGLLSKIPTGRGISSVLNAILEAASGKRHVLIIDSITDITKDRIRMLRKLADKFVIATSIDSSQRGKLRQIFFGSNVVIDLDNLRRDEALLLADAASVDLSVSIEDRDLLLNRIVSASNGNPRIILEIIEKERRLNRTLSSSTDISSESAEEPLSASLFLSAFLLIVVVSRYGASSVGLPDWKLLAIAAIFVLLPLISLDRILKWGSKQ